MTTPISPELKRMYYFWQLNESDRKELPKEVRADLAEQDIITDPKVFSECYRSVFRVMGGKNEENALSSQEKIMLDAINSKAANRVSLRIIPVMNEWKEEAPNIVNLTNYIQVGAKASLMIGASLTVAMTLFYLRSRKVLALASGCAACAFLVLRFMCFNKLSVSFNKYHKIIEALELKNYYQFYEQINNVYVELKKTNCLMRFYFNAHENRMEKKEHLGLQLLREQLSAVNHIQTLMKGLIESSGMLRMNRAFPTAPGSDPKSENPVDFTMIKTFFEKFEKLCQKGKYGIVGIGLAALAWTYYAYVQRAYLMTIAGMAGFLGAMMISRQLSVLERGSKNIHSAKDTQINPMFQEMVSQLFLLKLMALQKASNCQIQQAFVIPFDAVLKLSPFWKSKVPVAGTTSVSG